MCSLPTCFSSCQDLLIYSDVWCRKGLDTAKSRVSDALQDVLGSGRCDMMEFLYKVLDVVLPRVRKYGCVCALGADGWKKGEKAIIR